MSCAVNATVDGHTLSAKVATAKEAFAKAIEWQIARHPYLTCDALAGPSAVGRGAETDCNGPTRRF